MKRINKFILFLLIFSFTTLLIADEWSDYGNGNKSIENYQNVENMSAANGGGISVLAYSASNVGNSGHTSSPFNYFMNAFAENIDQKTGALILNQNDINLPGKAGLNLCIKRIYNSKSFSANPSWKSSHEKEWGGWAGFGWQFNIGAKLIVMEGNGYEQSKNYVILTLEGGSIYFEDTDKTGIYTNKGKGAFDYIKKINDTKYEYYSTDGLIYTFQTNYYLQHVVYDHYVNSAYNFVFKIKGFYLDKVTNIYNETINYVYEIFDTDESKDTYYNSGDYITNPVVTGEPSKQGEGQNGDQYPCEKVCTAVQGWTKECQDNSWQDQCNWARIDNQSTHTEWHPYRPISIIHSNGFTVNINYASNNKDSITSSQIIKLSYQKPDNTKYEYNYTFNSSGLLTTVKIPDGTITSFNYIEMSASHGTGYNDAGFLLSEFDLPSGLKSYYTYQWYDPKTDPLNNAANISVGASQHQASYIVTKVTKSNGYVVDYLYKGGSGVCASDSKDPKDKDMASLYFKEVQVTDLDGTNTSYYQNGLLMTQKNALGHQVDYTYSADNRVISLTTTRGTKKTKIEYANFDEFLYPQKTINYGDLNDTNDDQVTEVRYLTKSELQAAGISFYFGGLVKEKWEYSQARTSEKRNYIKLTYNLNSNFNYLPIKKSLIKGSQSTDITYEYDNCGRLTKETLPKNVVHAISYDDTNNSIQETMTYGSGYQTSKKTFFDKYTGNILQEYKENDLITQYSYDLLGRKVSETVYGNTTQYSYDLKNLKTAVTDPLGRKTIVYFDQAGKVIKIENTWQGTSVQSNYDVKGRVIKEIAEDGLTVEHFYDCLGREIKKTAQNKITTQVSFSLDNSEKGITDGLGHSKKYTYDAAERLIKIEEPDGTTGTLAYDCYSQLISAKDAKGLETRKTYDEFGRLSTETKPDGSLYKYEYDLYDNLVKEIKPDNTTVLYEYDEFNRNTRIYYSADSREIIKEYIKGGVNDGLLTRVKDDSGETYYYYDQRGRLIQKQTTILGKTYDQYWSYDQYDKLLDYSDVSGQKTYYAYNNEDKLSAIAADVSSVKTTLANYLYNKNKTLETATYGNGTVTKYSYDDLRRCTQIEVRDANASLVFRQVYTYDNNNNRTSLAFFDELDQIGKNYQYSYDLKDQLSSVIYPNKSKYIYTYDNNGNRTKFKHAFGEVNYTYAANSDKLLEYNDNGIVIKCTYDKEGNLIEKKYLDKTNSELKKLNYYFNSSSQLVKAVVSDSYDPKNNCQYDFIYNYLGEKIIETTSASIKTIYHNTNRFKTTVESDEQGNIKQRMIYGCYDDLLVRIDHVDNQKLVYCHNDILQSVVKLTDKTGKVLQTVLYGPFGEQDLSRGSADNDILFGGKKEYPQLELYYFGTRWYDPEIGRFISEDPAPADPAKLLSLNRYIYCLNNPYKYIDPSGEFWEEICSFLWEFICGSVKRAIQDGIDALLRSVQIMCNTRLSFAEAFNQAWNEARSGMGNTDGATKEIAENLFILGEEFLFKDRSNNMGQIDQGDPGDITKDNNKNYYPGSDGNLSLGDITISISESSDKGNRTHGGAYYYSRRAYGRHAGQDREMEAGSKINNVSFDESIDVISGPKYKIAGPLGRDSYYQYYIMKNEILYRVKLTHINGSWQILNLADPKYGYTVLSGPKKYYCEPHVDVNIRREDNNTYINPNKVVRWDYYD